MSGIVARWRRLSWAERRLLPEAVLALAVSALMVALLPFRRVAASVRPLREPAADQEAEALLARRVAWAVAASARRVPWRAKCLEQGIAAHWMLRRRRVGATLHYGVAQRPHGLLAHAWVRAGAIDVVGCENAGDFTELARFPGPPS